MDAQLTEEDTRALFDRLLTDEPPAHLDPALSFRMGRRLRRRRRAAYGLSAVGLTTALVTGSLTLLGGQTSNVAVTASGGSTPDIVTGPDGMRMVREPVAITARHRAIIAAVRDASPQGWIFDLAPPVRWWFVEPTPDPPGNWRESGDNAVDGTVDDGAGPGNLTVQFAPKAGSLTLRPCRDAEFGRGVTCTESKLPDGTVLSMRGLVDDQGVQTISVSLVHPDGTGVSAQAGNFAIDREQPPRFRRPGGYPGTRVPGGTEIPQSLAMAIPPVVTRDGPVYTLEQLAHVATAVDEAVHGADS